MPFEKPISSSFSELKEDLRGFLQTRFDLLRAELKEKIAAWKAPAAMLALAVLLLITAWFGLIFCIIAALHGAIAHTNFSWLWGGLIVTLLLVLSGVALGAAAYAGIRSASLKPTRTLRVLKQDQEWVQKQTRVA